MFGLFKAKKLYFLYDFPGFGERVVALRHTPSKQLQQRMKATGVGTLLINGERIDVYPDIHTPTRIWIKAQEEKMGIELQGDALVRAIESISTFSNPVPM